jgi:signal transduction histidine kinase
MTDPALVDRLAALPNLAEIPRSELAWLATHGAIEVYEAGELMAHKGRLIDKLWVILSGRVTVRVDHGAGPRLVMGWGEGEVSGMLPYSRMKGPPGNNQAESLTEALAIHQDQFREMIHACPKFTAYTVHLMLDRARNFNTSEMQDEKMVSLGRLSAGLAHELNNPASAIVRGAKLVRQGLSETDQASRALGAAGVGAEAMKFIEALCARGMADAGGGVLSPLQFAEREDEIAAWLDAHGCDGSHAATLAETGVDIDSLEELASLASKEALDPALRWISARSTAASLARDIEQAGTRVHDLVGAVKRFTYMDSRGRPDSVDVEQGLRDTIRVLASKARTQGTSIDLVLEPGLPTVNAAGGELNQVWMNLLDNALDAVGEPGHIEVTGRTERGRVVIRIIDNGEGIPPEILPKIFDPFFTTKPPGQGTGMGLEISRRLVRQYRGEISVQSRPGRTEFAVSLVPTDTGGDRQEA